MMSVNLLERLIEAEDHDRLLRDLESNGMLLPLSLRITLGQSEVAVWGLALIRVAELTYGPTTLSRNLIHRLRDRQQPEGGFAAEAYGDAVEFDVLSTAAAMAGLQAILSHHPLAAEGAEADELRQALSRGYAALGQQQDCDGLFTAATDRSAMDRALTTAFVVALLGQQPEFTRSLRSADLRAWFEQHDDRLNRAVRNLWSMAEAGLCSGAAGRDAAAALAA
jgi:hypothetical protein